MGSVQEQRYRGGIDSTFVCGSGNLNRVGKTGCENANVVTAVGIQEDY